MKMGSLRRLKRHPTIYIRDSRFSRLRTETPRLSVQVSSQKQTRYPNLGLKSLRISLGTETQTFQVLESESKVRLCESQNQNRNLNRNAMKVEFFSIHGVSLESSWQACFCGRLIFVIDNYFS